MKGAIMLSGGGSGKLFAAIGVTYPVGSTLTCTNGIKTLTAKTTSGQWVFAIPEAGTWTVTATDGTSSKSQSVSITSEGQFESVTLSYRKYIFKSGEGLADGYTISGKSYFYPSLHDWSPVITDDYVYTDGRGDMGWYINENIDVSNYSKLTARVKADMDSAWNLILRVNTAPQSGNGMTEYVAESKIDSSFNGKETTLSIDLSSLSEKTLYIGWDMRYVDVYVYDLYFE